MKEQIGKTAGRIWKVLKDEEEVSISHLQKTLKESNNLVHQSLGWLAREDKIEYRKQGRTTLVSLAETERINLR